MEDQVLLTHRPNGVATLEESLEVGSNVGRAVPIAIDLKVAVLDKYYTVRKVYGCLHQFNTTAN